MRTTAKPVVEAIRKHIISYFEDEAADRVDKDEVQAIRKQLNYMNYDNRSIYRTALDWVEGGGALIYFEEVKEFLSSLGINPTNKEYEDDKSWKLYCHLVAREMTKLYEGAK